MKPLFNSQRVLHKNKLTWLFCFDEQEASQPATGNKQLGRGGSFFYSRQHGTAPRYIRRQGLTSASGMNRSICVSMHMLKSVKQQQEKEKKKQTCHLQASMKGSAYMNFNHWPGSVAFPGMSERAWQYPVSIAPSSMRTRIGTLPAPPSAVPRIYPYPSTLLKGSC